MARKKSKQVSEPKMEESLLADSTVHKEGLPEWLEMESNSSPATATPQPALPNPELIETITSQSEAAGELPDWLSESIEAEPPTLTGSVESTESHQENLQEVAAATVDLGSIQESTAVSTHVDPVISVLTDEVSLPGSFSKSTDEFALSPLPKVSAEESNHITAETGSVEVRNEAVEAKTNAVDPFAYDGVKSEGSQTLDEIIANIDRSLPKTPEFTSVVEVKTNAPQRTTRDGKQYVILTLAETEYAIPIENIREVGSTPSVSTVPHVPDWVKGITNIRGEVISVVDMSSLFGTSGVGASRGRMLLAQTKSREVNVAFIVDRVNRIRYIKPTQFQAFELEQNNALAPFISGATEMDGKLLLSLDMEKLLTSEQIQVTAA